MTGMHTSHTVILEAVDANGASRVLPKVQGDPSYGERMHDQREVVDVLVRGQFAGAVMGDEQAEELSWSAVDCDEAQAFGAWVRGESTAVSVNPAGDAFALKARVTKGGHVYEWSCAFWRTQDVAGTPATVTISARAYGKTEV